MMFFWVYSIYTILSHFLFFILLVLLPLHRYQCSLSLVKNYVQKICSRNRLRFFWIAWSALTKRPHFIKKNCDCDFRNSGACNVPLGRYFEYLSNRILESPKFPKICMLTTSVCWMYYLHYLEISSKLYWNQV